MWWRPRHALEFTCWNGEIVRVAFALDCHDREVIGWTATTARHRAR
jgi:transposase InsO family protein